MDIIVFDKKRGRTRTFRLSAVVVAIVAVLGLGALVGDGLLLQRYLAQEPSDGQVISIWRQRAAAHEREVQQLTQQAESQMTAVGRKLAAMEARLLRMEALGERVSEVAKLTNGEFRFDEPAAVGGPEQSEREAPPNYLSAIGDLSLRLSERERELEVLEALIANRRLHEDLAPSGRPVTWGWMSSPYGDRIDPMSGRPAWHHGIDFAGRPGSDVIVVASGVVVNVGKRSGYGMMVEVNHGSGYVTRYAHHKEVLVDIGDVVKKGDVIARMGSTGRSTGPHVHFEVLKNGRHVDPAKYVAKR